MVHRFVRHHRPVLPGLHPVGAVDRSAAGDEGGGHHRRPARPVADPAGAPAHSGSTTSSAGATWSPTRKIPAGCACSPDNCGPNACWRGQRQGCRSGEAARALLGTGAPWFESWLEHPEHDDPFWSRLQLHEALDRTEIPVLLISGWQDLFLEQTLAQYRASAAARRARSRLTVGPWTHTQMMTKGGPTVIRESLDWLDTHLSSGRGARPSPVRIYVNGHGWLDLPDWPPAMPELVRYLQPGGRLGDAAPPDTARRRVSPTTRPIRRLPSAAGCSHPRAATATTPSWRSAPTC